MKTKFLILYLIACFQINIYLEAQIPAEGLKVYYPFNGNANDESGNGNHGNVKNATLTSDACKNPNSAYYFNGENAYITSTHAINLDLTNEITLSLWIKKNTPHDNPQTISPIIDIQDHGIYYIFESDLNFILSSSSTAYGSLIEGDQYIDDNWHHLLQEYSDSNGTRTLYIDGINVYQDKLNITLQPMTDIFCIGYNQTPFQDFYEGCIDNVRIYNRALSYPEIELLLHEFECNLFKITGDTMVCAGQSLLQYKLLFTHNITNFTWVYRGTGGIIFGRYGDDISMNFTDDATSGYLIVYGSDLQGQILDSASLFINVIPLPSTAGEIIGPDTVCAGQSEISYSVSPVSNASNYFWNYSGTGISILGYSNSVIINFDRYASDGNLVVTTNNFCGNGEPSKVFPIVIKPCAPYDPDQIFIPNVFSPNADGINDEFIIDGLTDHSKLIITNRNGKILFMSENYQNNWKGIDQEGKLLPADTYWYYLSMPGYSSEFKGYVYLKR